LEFSQDPKKVCHFVQTVAFTLRMPATELIFPVMIAGLRPLVLIAVAMLSVLSDFSYAQSESYQRRRLSFTGLVDADFASNYGTFDAVEHRTGLEADLTTRLEFSPILNAEVRTTMRDGNAPKHGLGNTWAPLRYDGAQVNWKPGEKFLFMAGDLVGGKGYFQYQRYRRIAAVVGEHSIRGAGLKHGNILVHTGVATDSNGMANDWSVYAEWSRKITPSISWSPSFRYTGGIPKATPFELGVSFQGDFDGMLLLNAQVGMNYWSTSTDAGSLILIEPRYIYEPYFVAITLMHSDKGEVPAPNAPRFTETWNNVEDVLIAVEPGLSLDKTYAASLGVEYRNPNLNNLRDESLWLIPTLHISPAPRADWRVWTSLEKPLLSGSAGHPSIGLGSEIAFTF